MHHARPKDLKPAGTAAEAATTTLALEALDGNLTTRFHEREVITSKPYSGIPTEDASAELEQGLLKVAERYVRINRQSFDLVEHPVMCRIGGLITVRPARNYEP